MVILVDNSLCTLPPRCRQHREEEDVVREGDEAPSPKLVEHRLGVQVQLGGDGVHLGEGHGDELVQPQVLRLLLTRGNGAEEVLRGHHHLGVTLLIHQLVGGKIAKHLSCIGLENILLSFYEKLKKLNII